MTDMTGKKLSLPDRVHIGDITVRDGLQALEHYFPADKKVRLAEDLILAGFKDLEISNFGHPKFLPQFKDVEEVLDRLFQSERVGHMLKANGGDVQIHVVTIKERATDRAIEFKAKRGYGPDYLLQMVSTDEHHHKVNSGTSLEDYWKMTERCTAKAHEAGCIEQGQQGRLRASVQYLHHRGRATEDKRQSQRHPKCRDHRP